MFFLGTKITCSAYELSDSLITPRCSMLCISVGRQWWSQTNDFISQQVSLPCLLDNTSWCSCRDNTFAFSTDVNSWQNWMLSRNESIWHSAIKSIKWCALVSPLHNRLCLLWLPGCDKLSVYLHVPAMGQYYHETF